MNGQDLMPRTLSSHELRAALHASAASPRTDYLADIVRDAGRTRQRPGWTLPGRWVPAGVGQPRGVALLAVLALLVALLLVPAILVRSRPDPPAIDLGIFEPIAGRIVFGNEWGIWAVDPAAPDDAADMIQVSEDPGTPLEWSHDGTQLLVLRGEPAEGQRLAILAADGTERILSPGATAIQAAAFSPDSSRVVFAGNVEGQPGIFTVAVAGGTPVALSTGIADGCCQAPAWGPDGARIAFFAGGGDTTNSLWVMNADGSDAHVIVENEDDHMPGHVRGLAWSSDGERIAFGLGGSIYMSHADGSGVTQVAGGATNDDSDAYATSPTWSPDAGRLAWTAGCGGGRPGACHLVVADADGSNARSFFGTSASGPWHPGEP